MTTERMKALWLGLFVIAAGVLITWLVLFLRPSLGDGGKTLKIRFSNIEKVGVGTRVTFAGKPVGEVVEINEIYNAREQPTDLHGDVYTYELVIRLDSGVHVYNYDEIVFSTAGLLGEKSIAIIPRQSPPGSPPAHEVTEDVLYARSSDKLDETLTKLNEVADVAEQAMSEILCFFKESGTEIHNASKEISSFFAQANEKDLAGNFATAIKQAVDGDLIPTFVDTAKNIRMISGHVASGQGCLGQLLYNPALTYQLETTLCRFEQVLQDIHDFGILFQFDSRWQRMRRLRACREMKAGVP